MDLIALPPMKWKKNVPLVCKIGGLVEDSVDLEFPSKFTAFGFFRRCTHEMISTLLEAGPAVTPGMGDECHFYYQLVAEEAVVDFVSATPVEAMKLEYQLPALVPSRPFAHVLTHCCQISLLLPLFQQLGMTTVDGAVISHFLEGLLSLLVNLFALGRDAPMSFKEINGFGIIAHLLSKLPGNFITHAIYIGFFGLLESLSNSDLQIQLINMVLMKWE
jgi:hypothetical protein